MKKMKLTESKKEVKYLGEGIVGVYERGRLTERYQLEKGDNLVEGLKGLMEASKFYKSFEDFLGRLIQSERMIGRRGLYSNMPKITNFNKYEDALEDIQDLGGLTGKKKFLCTYSGYNKSLGVKGIGPKFSDDVIIEGVDNIVQAIQLLWWAFPEIKKMDVADRTPTADKYDPNGNGAYYDAFITLFV